MHKPQFNIKASALPDSVDNSKWDTPVGNQDGVGSCVAWAVDYNTMGYYRDRYLGTIQPLTSQSAPMFTYAQIVRGSGPDVGTSVQSNANILQSEGDEPINAYSYGINAAQFDYTSQPTASDVSHANSYLLSSYNLVASNYSGSGGIGSSGQIAIEQVLASGNVGTITIPVYSEFMNNHGTPVTTPAAGSVFYGWHEVMYDGYNASGIDIENQWGVSWGSSGHVLLTWAFVRQYAIEAWSYQFNLPSPQSTPTPVPTSTLIPTPVYTSTTLPTMTPTPVTPTSTPLPPIYDLWYHCTWWISGSGCYRFTHTFDEPYLTTPPYGYKTTWWLSGSGIKQFTHIQGLQWLR